MMPSAAPPSRSGTLLLLGAIYLLLEAYLWLILPTRNSILIGIGAVVILMVMVIDPMRRGESAATIGLSMRHPGPAIRIVMPATLLLMAGLYLLHQWLPDSTSPDWTRFLKRFLNILPWALLQQGILQATFNRRITSVTSAGWGSALLIGAAFGGMHLPNVLLVFLTFVMGTFWARAYQQAPNLWILVLSHALLSAAAQTAIPAASTHGFRVGPGYYRWHP